MSLPAICPTIPEVTWKVGDWVLHEFQICQIKQISSDGRVTSVSDGRFERSSLDLTDALVPLTLRNKAISEEFQHFHNELHALERVNLNYPRIRDWFVAEWRRVVSLPETAENIFAQARDFVRSVKDHVESQRQIEFNGIYLFR